MQTSIFTQKLMTKIQVARAALKMETAIVSYINNDNYTLLLVDSEMEDVFKNGMVFPLKDTYCRDVYNFNQVMRYRHVGSMDNMLQHPVYQSVKLESYLAAPITNSQNKVIGTVNFTSLFAQKQNFTDSQVKIVKDLATYVESHIEQYLSLAEQTNTHIVA